MAEGTDYRRAADHALAETYEEPMALTEYVDRLMENPVIGAHAASYLLAAIEAEGTRSVIEEGETVERHRFFDDPHNDGEHAVLGNTEVLNGFVDDLRSIAAGRGRDEKIVWFEGPTATGKSELKRCLIDGLEAFSLTDAGRRYTLEWNVRSVGSDDRGLSYGADPTVGDDEHWYESPVQVHPLSVFPEAVREELVADVNADGEHVPIEVAGRLDPFSRESYGYLEERYRRQGRDDLFSSITDERHLRVRNYVVGVGRGIGVLHSEDEGTPKERLVGSWMHGMVQKLDSRGRKNPQAFSYDGVLSQGNGVLTVVEDAAQHADLLRKLLNVPDERRVKLDKGIGMDVDTQLVIISNPDLDAQLNQHADRGETDPLKALKRRLDRHEFAYLTNLSLEVELLRRELTGETRVRTLADEGERRERVREAVTVDVREGPGAVRSREFAPHAIEAAALFAVVTRLDEADLPAGLDLVEKALVFDRGYLEEGEDRTSKDDLDFEDGATDGEGGIPVTYTRDVLADVLQEESERSHPELAVEDVITPEDVLEAMTEGLSGAPVFSTGERSTFENRVPSVRTHLFERQEADVIEAITFENRVDEETVADYVEQVYAWETGEALTNDRGEAIEPDPLEMKLFEIEALGRFSESAYDGTRPGERVEEFRRRNVITALNRHAWEHRDEGFAAGSVDLASIPAIESVLARHDWADVRRTFEELHPRQWEDPPQGTETEAVKARTVETMAAEFGYSEAAAELTSNAVMERVSYRWD